MKWRVGQQSAPVSLLTRRRALEKSPSCLGRVSQRVVLGAAGQCPCRLLHFITAHCCRRASWGRLAGGLGALPFLGLSSTGPSKRLRSPSVPVGPTVLTANGAILECHDSIPWPGEATTTSVIRGEPDIKSETLYV